MNDYRIIKYWSKQRGGRTTVTPAKEGRGIPDNRRFNRKKLVAQRWRNHLKNLGPVAQLVERKPEELRVGGSIPPGPTTFYPAAIDDWYQSATLIQWYV